MSNYDGSTWMELYRAAMLELDPQKLPARVEEALKSAESRAWELAQQNGSREEQGALRDAMQNLRVLRRGMAGGSATGA
jgi:hypothetical protein